MLSKLSPGMRYLMVTGTGVVVDYLVFLLSFSLLGIPVAQTLARISGAIAGFVGHKYFSFPGSGGGRARTARQLMLFVLLWLLNLLLSTGLILVLHQNVGLVPWLAKFTAECLLLPVSFWIMRSVIFKPDRAT